MLRRKLYDRLVRWKNESGGATALLIEGARRVGKSTIAEELVRCECASYLLVDFSLATDEFKQIFPTRATTSIASSSASWPSTARRSWNVTWRRIGPRGR